MISVILQEGVELPKYETPGSAGMDVKAISILKVFKGDIEVPEDKLQKIRENFVERGYIKLRGFERILFGTGITVADMSPDTEIQVRSRSSVALKRGLIVANSPGTVDSDYRSEIGVIIYNSTPYLSKVDKNERIAQLVPAKVCKEEFGKTTEIIPTSRTGGFGSTGTK